ncbi:MAG: hypothetical protein ACLQHF_09895 [Terracidiphilus sp.]
MTDARKNDLRTTLDTSNRFLLDAHLNEYQALTTRATYYVVMSTAIWPLIFLYLTFLVTVWQTLSKAESADYGVPLMVWGGGLGVQVALLIWTFLVCEQYKIVLYVEKDLRLRVQNLMPTPDFWLYEQKLRPRTRPLRWLELQTELWVFVGILVAVVLRIWISHGFAALDRIGLTLNLVALVALVLMAVSAAKIRHKWEA